MIKLDLIEFADLASPIQIVNEIIKQLPDLTIPVPLDEIATTVGIEKIEYSPLDGFEGVLLANPEKTTGGIIINSNSRHHRQRFSLGHELGHFMIPRHGHEMHCGINDLTTSESKQLTSKQRIELEANQFSAELLMPSKIFKSRNGFNVEPSMECLLKQAEDFDVSFEACALRYCSQHDDPVAIVFSHQGTVRYSCSSTEFPFWITPGKNSPIPPTSFTKHVLNKPASSIISDCSVSSNWIGSDRYYETPDEIIEEVYILENGYAATMLSFEDELEEKE